MLAVLEDAIACFQKYAFARDRKERLISKRSSIGFRTVAPVLKIGQFR
jgi:hypothetical protein